MVRLRYALALAVLGLAACGPASSRSDTKDIYVEDQGDQAIGTYRRHPASSDEVAWTISMNGCTGHLIGPRHMMTAEHCSPRAGATYTSGAAMAAGSRSDIRVERVAEMNANLDYAILEISWTGTYPAPQRFPKTVATQPSDVTLSLDNHQGDEIFTIGFPADKRDWGATYSRGRLLGAQGGHLYYNMGIINGNSGGGVWRVKDHMLVSLTNNGPRAFGQQGWDSAHADSRRLGDHNHGTAMWEVYRASRLLKELFPNGVSQEYDTHAAAWRKGPRIVSSCYCGRSSADECGIAKEGSWVSAQVRADSGKACDADFCQQKFWSDYVRKCDRKMLAAEVPFE